LRQYADALDAKSPGQDDGLHDDFRQTALDLTLQQPQFLWRHAGLCVLWKPAGWTVSVYNNGGDLRGASKSPKGDADGTRIEQWLMQAGTVGAHIAQDPKVSHGILHRLDKDTSGALLVASSYTGYYMGMLQFAARKVIKEYMCICHKHVPRGLVTLNASLLEPSLNDGLLKTVVSPLGKPAHTEITLVGHFYCKGQPFSLVAVRLHTGRQHQIRVHLASSGYPLVGDKVYGNDSQVPSWCTRTLLHARRLSIPTCDIPIDIKSPAPLDVCGALDRLVPVDCRSCAIRDLLIGRTQAAPPDTDP